MDAITLLKADHKTVSNLFRSFERSKDLRERRRLADSIIEQLSVHAAIEEQIFYPTARAEVEDATSEVLEAVEEHHVVKWLLSELQGMDPEDERFVPKAMFVIELVRNHVEEEENILFPMVRTTLGRKRLAEVGAALEQAKPFAPREPMPNTARH